MPKREVTNTQRVVHQNTEVRASGHLRDYRSLGQEWAPSDAGLAARRNRDPPHWSDDDEDALNQVSTRNGPTCNIEGEPLSPPPPYTEYNTNRGGGEVLANDRSNPYPAEGWRTEYDTYRSGRRERYVTAERDKRVLWPFADHENSSDDGDGDPDMIHLDSGRILPRSEWEANHQWEPSSDEPSDNTNREASQSHRHALPRTRGHPTRPSEHGESGGEVPRGRSGHSTGLRHRRRQSPAGREGQCHNPASEVTSKVRARDTARLIISRDPFEWSTELKDISQGCVSGRRYT